jgi:hypothetical protein
MLELNITSNYLDRTKVYAKDRIGLIFFFCGAFQRYERLKRYEKDDMISN